MVHKQQLEQMVHKLAHTLTDGLPAGTLLAQHSLSLLPASQPYTQLCRSIVVADQRSNFEGSVLVCINHHQFVFLFPNR